MKTHNVRVLASARGADQVPFLLTRVGDSAEAAGDEAGDHRIGNRCAAHVRKRAQAPQMKGPVQELIRRHLTNPRGCRVALGRRQPHNQHLLPVMLVPGHGTPLVGP
jgi:hypothetical protein